MAHPRDCTCGYCSYLVHQEHAGRELYEFNIDTPCPCATCAEGRSLTSVHIVGVYVVVAILLLLNFWSQ